MLTTIAIFIVILGILIFVHEFGHFWVAKKSGMKVDEFGFGFPPRLLGIQKVNGKRKLVWGHPSTSRPQEAGSGTGQASLPDEGTIYSINWIPLGGFVKIVGENNDHQDDPRSFVNRPFWGRFFTLVAGVSMNLVLAWALITIGLIIGLPVATDNVQSLPKTSVFKHQSVAIMEVQPGRPADSAGLRSGDILLSIDGQKFEQGSQASGYIRSVSGKVLRLEVKRGQEVLNFEVHSIAKPEPGEGPTGINIASVGELSFPWYFAPVEGVKMLGVQIYNFAGGLLSLLEGKVGLKNVGGPVKIAQLTGQVADMGFVYLLQFASFLSINLAILNILPFPALDGGRVLFLLIEKIRGKRNNHKIEQAFNVAGFALLLMLMLVVTIHDLSTLTLVKNFFGRFF